MSSPVSLSISGSLELILGSMLTMQGFVAEEITNCESGSLLDFFTSKDLGTIENICWMFTDCIVGFNV